MPRGGGNAAAKNRTVERFKRESGNLESTIPIHEGKDKGKMPKETNEEVQKGVLKHEMGKASQIEKSSEFTLPILGNEPQMENESRGKGGGKRYNGRQ